jgi:signal transduction histidine kinase
LGGEIRKRTRAARLRESLRLGRPIVVLAVGVLLPVVLSSSLGIVAIALWESSKDLVLGILGLCLASAAVGGGVIVTVLLGRRARLARLQSDLIGNVSHELKTPLAAIRMYAQTLASGVVDREPTMARECVEAISRETEWLESMIERLLTWRAAARDRENLDLVAAPVAGAVEDAATRFSRMLPASGTTFEASVVTSLPVLHDPAAISSILLNLLTNAYKYTGEEKHIRLSVHDEGSSVRLRVTDNGPGIPESERTRIFQPFYRLEGSGGSGKSGGAGLGLAIVDVLVKAHGGTVCVNPVSPHGSEFVVSLPAARGPTEKP